MENTTTQSPATDADESPVDAKRLWIRRLGVGVACVPLAVISVLHTMGRSDEFGMLGEWFVMIPLAVAGLFAWTLIEKAVYRLGPPTTSAEGPPSA